MTVNNLSPEEVNLGLQDHSLVLIDVREPAEYDAERIEGALLFPLSTFAPQALPENGSKRIVLQCGSGMRSQKALAACQNAGVNIDCHLAGGIQAWKSAGFTTLMIDPATGNLHRSA